MTVRTRADLVALPGYVPGKTIPGAIKLASNEVVGARQNRVALTPGHGLDLDAMADAITPATRLVFVCNPNNPTGTALRTEEIEAFIDRVPSDVLVVLDEAYKEFV